MGKRYVAGQPVDKDKLLKVLQDFGVDELWVDFENPFNYTRSKGKIDWIYLVWYDDKMSKEHTKVSNEIISIFDPDYDSDEDEIVARVNMLPSYSIGREHILEIAENSEPGIRQIYSKEDGFLG